MADLGQHPININALGVSAVRGHLPAPKSRQGGLLEPN